MVMLNVLTPPPCCNSLAVFSWFRTVDRDANEDGHSVEFPESSFHEGLDPVSGKAAQPGAETSYRNGPAASPTIIGVRRGYGK